MIITELTNKTETYEAKQLNSLLSDRISEISTSRVVATQQSLQPANILGKVTAVSNAVYDASFTNSAVWFSVGVAVVVASAAKFRGWFLARRPSFGEVKGSRAARKQRQAAPTRAAGPKKKKGKKAAATQARGPPNPSEASEIKRSEQIKLPSSPGVSESGRNLCSSSSLAEETLLSSGRTQPADAPDENDGSWSTVPFRGTITSGKLKQGQDTSDTVNCQSCTQQPRSSPANSLVTRNRTRQDVRQDVEQSRRDSRGAERFGRSGAAKGQAMGAIIQGRAKNAAGLQSTKALQSLSQPDLEPRSRGKQQGTNRRQFFADTTQSPMSASAQSPDSDVASSALPSFPPTSRGGNNPWRKLPPPELQLKQDVGRKPGTDPASSETQSPSETAVPPGLNGALAISKEQQAESATGIVVSGLDIGGATQEPPDCHETATHVSPKSTLLRHQHESAQQKTLGRQQPVEPPQLPQPDAQLCRPDDGARTWQSTQSGHTSSALSDQQVQQFPQYQTQPQHPQQQVWTLEQPQQQMQCQQKAELLLPQEQPLQQVAQTSPMHQQSQQMQEHQQEQLRLSQQQQQQQFQKMQQQSPQHLTQHWSPLVYGFGITGPSYAPVNPAQGPIWALPASRGSMTPPTAGEDSGGVAQSAISQPQLSQHLDFPTVEQMGVSVGSGVLPHNGYVFGYQHPIAHLQQGLPPATYAIGASIGGGVYMFDNSTSMYAAAGRPPPRDSGAQNYGAPVGVHGSAVAQSVASGAGEGAALSACTPSNPVDPGFFQQVGSADQVALPVATLGAMGPSPLTPSDALPADQAPSSAATSVGGELTVTVADDMPTDYLSNTSAQVSGERRGSSVPDNICTAAGSAAVASELQRSSCESKPLRWCDMTDSDDEHEVSDRLSGAEVCADGQALRKLEASAASPSLAVQHPADEVEEAGWRVVPTRSANNNNRFTRRRSSNASKTSRRSSAIGNGNENGSSSAGHRFALRGGRGGRRSSNGDFDGRAEVSPFRGQEGGRLHNDMMHAKSYSYQQYKSQSRVATRHADAQPDEFSVSDRSKGTVRQESYRNDFPSKAPSSRRGDRWGAFSSNRSPRGSHLPRSPGGRATGVGVNSPRWRESTEGPGFCDHQQPVLRAA